MNCISERWWEEVEHIEGEKLGRVIKGKYVLHDSIEYPDGMGWDSVADFRKHAKQARDFIEEVDPGSFKFDNGTHYGINEYRLITFKL